MVIRQRQTRMHWQIRHELHVFCLVDFALFMSMETISKCFRRLGGYVYNLFKTYVLKYLPMSSNRNTARGNLFMWSLKNQVRIYYRSYELEVIIDNGVNFKMRISILNFILISSIFFWTCINAFFSRKSPPTATSVQKDSSILIFSLFSMGFSPKKSKRTILSLSCFVWVNGSKIVTLSCNVMLWATSWWKF